jgi:hypothetical protein
MCKHYNLKNQFLNNNSFYNSFKEEKYKGKRLKMKIKVNYNKKWIADVKIMK